MTTISTSTALDRPITAWLTRQRALGRQYDNEERVLASLQRFIARFPVRDLDQKSFDLWCDTLRDLDANTRRARQRIVRKFCLYRQRTEPGCFVPNPLYFARRHPGRMPVIVGPEHVARMLAATEALRPAARSPLLPAVMRLAIVILYTAGLRRGELLRLTLDDIEPRTGILRIRSSKFHKSRLVPLSPEAGNELRAYLSKRLALSLDASPHAPLLCNIKGGLRGYTGTGLSRGIHALFKIARVHDCEGSGRASTISVTASRCRPSCAGTGTAPMCNRTCPGWPCIWAMCRLYRRRITCTSCQLWRNSPATGLKRASAT